ncbi:hypothetical protein VPHK460_0259 [Vibrio phage K460]
MWKFLRKLLGLELSSQELEILKAVETKQRHLKEFGGRIVITSKGGFRDEFDTKEGKSLYYKSIKERYYEDK